MKKSKIIILMKLFLSFALLVSSLFSQSCSRSRSSDPNESAQCSSKERGLIFRDGLGAEAQSLAFLNLTNPFECKTLFAARINGCGQFIENIRPSQWVIESAYGYIESMTAESAIFCFNKGSTPALEPSFLAVQLDSEIKTIPVSISWTPNTMSDLMRWYKADSYEPLASLSKVGVSGQTPWSELSSLSPKYLGVASSNREPLFVSPFLGFSALAFCGQSAGCGVSQNQHIRIASQFGEFANTDLSLIYVVARSSTSANYLLVNQSNGNNTGTFLGWLNNTQFRFGLAGPGGTPQVTATVEAYSGSPVIEIWHARLNTGSDLNQIGLSLYRNNKMMAANTDALTQQAPAVTIPYIGTQRTDHNNARFHLFETLIYSRALSPRESCRIHRYLAEKYKVVLNEECAL